MSIFLLLERLAWPTQLTQLSSSRAAFQQSKTLRIQTFEWHWCGQHLVLPMRLQQDLQRNAGQVLPRPWLMKCPANSSLGIYWLSAQWSGLASACINLPTKYARCISSAPFSGAIARQIYINWPAFNTQLNQKVMLLPLSANYKSTEITLER